MKKIINHPNDVVTEMMQGMAKSNPGLKYSQGLEVISLKKKIRDKVGVISGGGAGHEPSFAGYVRKGLLDAAVSGNVFSSPSPDRILEAIREADSGQGVLMVIMNYSGDIMNFEMAKELAEAEEIKTEIVVVRDDVAVPESTYSTGRRGIAGTLLVLKAAGAKAMTGASLDEVKKTAEKAITNVRSMGMAMTPCILPAVGKYGFELGENEIEIGMGIHGEPGIEKTNVKTAHELAEILINKILEDYDYQNADVTVMINGMGATPLMELYILFSEVYDNLEGRGIHICKSYIGNYMTSLEMAGCSISLLKMDGELKELFGMDSDAVTSID